MSSRSSFLTSLLNIIIILILPMWLRHVRMGWFATTYYSCIMRPCGGTHPTDVLRHYVPQSSSHIISPGKSIPAWLSVGEPIIQWGEPFTTFRSFVTAFLSQFSTLHWMSFSRSSFSQVLTHIIMSELPTYLDVVKKLVPHFSPQLPIMNELLVPHNIIHLHLP